MANINLKEFINYAQGFGDSECLLFEERLNDVVKSFLLMLLNEGRLEINNDEIIEPAYKLNDWRD